jgi:hypothetical protein
MKCALYVASTPNYLKYTNALVNSIQKNQLCHGDIDVYFLYNGNISDAYITECKEKFMFNFIPIKIKRTEVDHIDGMKENEFVKRARFKYILDTMLEYDVVCMMDADMFIVSREFTNLFNMVYGTQNIIACNERFKWDIEKYYYKNDEPIFDKPKKLTKMHCSVPIIFNPLYYVDVFKMYLDIAFFGYQIKNGVRAGIGDIFAWNIAMEKCKMSDNVVVFPMETMTQVHQTNCKPWLSIQKHKDKYFTFAGDHVYTVHGRVATQNWFDGHVDRALTDGKKNGNYDEICKNISRIKKGLKNIQQEWYDLNFNQYVKLDKYEKYEPFYDDFRK